MKKKAIIFGSNGQDGYYLSKLLINEGLEVIGIDRSGNCIPGDVSDLSFVENLIKEHTPDHIFHFAALSTTKHAALFDNHRIISTGTLNILESVYRHSKHTKVFLSASAMQFENKGRPINEQTPFCASSPYSIARIQSVYAGRYYRSIGLAVYVGYFFNHDSALRTEQHINKKITEAVKRIAKGSAEKLEIGDIDVQKEFNFAGDIVEAVWKLMGQDTVPEVVIGSGKAYSIKDWLIACFSKFNLNWQDHVIIKKGFTPEYKILVSDPALLKSIGWSPKVDFHNLVDLMMTNEQ